MEKSSNPPPVKSAPAEDGSRSASVQVLVPVTQSMETKVSTPVFVVSSCTLPFRLGLFDRPKGVSVLPVWNQPPATLKSTVMIDAEAEPATQIRAPNTGPTSNSLFIAILQHVGPTRQYASLAT